MRRKYVFAKKEEEKKALAIFSDVILWKSEIKMAALFGHGNPLSTPVGQLIGKQYKIYYFFNVE